MPYSNNNNFYYEIERESTSVKIIVSELNLSLSPNTRIKWTLDNNQYDDYYYGSPVDHTFTGLSSRSTYTAQIDVVFLGSSGNEVFADHSGQFTIPAYTNDDDDDDVGGGEYEITKAAGVSSIKITVAGLNQGDLVRVECYNASTGAYICSNQSNASRTGKARVQSKNLLSNTRYRVKVYILGAYYTTVYVTTELPHFEVSCEGNDVYVELYEDVIDNLEASGMRIDILDESNNIVLGINDPSKISYGKIYMGTINTAGTYIAKAYLYFDDVLDEIGAVSFEISISRPGNWRWISTITSEAVIQLNAKEWNDFTNCINKFREYKKLSPYNFTTVESIAINPSSLNNKIRYDIINEARVAISQINGHNSVYLPPEIKSGDQIAASVFNGLKDALNAIP